jgi:paraquat-inducible protein B
VESTLAVLSKDLSLSSKIHVRMLTISYNSSLRIFNAVFQLLQGEIYTHAPKDTERHMDTQINNKMHFKFSDEPNYI